jgi:hypothetical protein
MISLTRREFDAASTALKEVWAEAERQCDEARRSAGSGRPKLSVASGSRKPAELH